MSCISPNANGDDDRCSDIKTSDNMTPNTTPQTILPCIKNENSDDDDDAVVVLGKTENLTNHNYFTSILATNQEESYEVLKRDNVTPHDVVLGRGGNDKGPYAAALKDWWPKYAAANHSTKRTICRDAIKDMYERGVRFINRMDDSSRHGYYTIEPKASARVERKVLRSLRQEVLNFTPQTHHKTKDSGAELDPGAQTVKTKRPLKKKVSKKTTPVKVKAKRKAESSIPARKTMKIQGKGDATYDIQVNTKYIPILPAPSRSKEHSMIVIPPPQVPPPSSDVVPPPAMRMNCSLGSVTGPKNEPYIPLIPSAINFGISDLAIQDPKKRDALSTQPHTIASSPDTVFALDFLSFLNSSFGMEMVPQDQDVKNLKSVDTPPLLSTPSFDFKGIFDDKAVDNVMNEVEATICPPILTGRQSSMFSAMSFKEWSQNQKDRDSFAASQVRTEHSKAAPAAVPQGIGIHDAVVTPSKHFDRNTIFDEGMMHVSPTAMYYNITNEVEHFVNGNSLPYITPQDKGYDLARRTTSTPTRSNAKRSISEEFETPDKEAYHELCHKLEDSMAKLEHEEMQHKNWEAHNEGLWRHFIQEQPDLAKMLLSRGGRNSGSYESPVPTTTVIIPPRPTTRSGGGNSNCGDSITVDSRNTSPVPWWFYHDNMPSDNSCSGHPSVSLKWQQLFASDNEEGWEEV